MTLIKNKYIINLQVNFCGAIPLEAIIEVGVFSDEIKRLITYCWIIEHEVIHVP